MQTVINIFKVINLMNPFYIFSIVFQVTDLEFAIRKLLIMDDLKCDHLSLDMLHLYRQVNVYSNWGVSPFGKQS